MKNNFKDYVNFRLIKKGYFNFEEVKAADLQEVIEDYFYNELGIEKGTNDIFALFAEYKKQAGEEGVLEVVNYLLNSISIMQGGENIEWWQFGQNREPSFFYDEETNKIIYLNTSIEIDYQQLFSLLINTLIDLKVSKEEERIK